ncbi:hydantoinase/oxoprolinase family protein [Acuticoccus kandeliae]|uniref:hydantoinase/oxoprolinase family protein n=1 Tax=Acuticoccus kandeliae TaxID=2073160 RepID=UPI000D3E6347|nr:hydantoinase/oxoprolinase family protein [Acuticoccus kandeliae]
MDRLSLSIDIGGTFTDLVAWAEGSGAYVTHKELTTPDDPTRGVVSGLNRLFARHGLAFGAVSRVVHATTLLTNALIERKGAPTGLITTAGFRDILEIGREQKYTLYDIFLSRPEPLVPRPLRLEVRERIDADGTVVTPLDEDGVIEAATALVAAGAQSIAIAFLHAYANPAPERRARDLIAARFPDIYVSISSEIAPQIREYERTSTTAANAYIRPLTDRYLGRMEAALKGLGIEADLFLMLSNGGFTNVAEAKRNPIQMLESGPAAGALAGAYFGARSGFSHILAFDMGGTTAKLAVIDDGKPRVVHQFEAGRQERFIEGSGLPLNISTVELIEIGAGGGSIANVDELGLVKVGPQSAGSAPGPACYQLGGSAPTVTDMNLMLGFLDPASFGDGSIRLSKDAATAAAAPLPDATGLSLVDTAWGVRNLVDETMASAARVHVSEHGQDPRRYALLTTGGGGPLHGCHVAQKLGIRTVVCPPSAGVASALGLLMAPTRIDRVRTLNTPLDAIDLADLEHAFSEIEDDARRIVAESGIDPATATATRFADLRYRGQGFELVVELPEGPYEGAARAAIIARFEDDYRAVHGRLLKDGAVEIVNIRACVEAGSARQDRPFGGSIAQNGSAPAPVSRPIFHGGLGAFVDTPIFARAALPADTSIAGPAAIEEAGSTLLIPPTATARVEPDGTIVVTLHPTDGSDR